MPNGFSSKNMTSIVGLLTSIAPTKLHAEGSEAKAEGKGSDGKTQTKKTA
jgi:hypothetical protein